MFRNQALRVVAATLFVAGLVVSAAGVTGAAPPGKHVVTLSGTVFNPQTLPVTVGDEITWKVLDGQHHIVADGSPPLFDSGPLALGGNEEFEWTVPDVDGPLMYRCTIHEADGMVGALQVSEAPAPTTTTTTTAPPPTTTTTTAPPATTTTTTRPASAPTTTPTTTRPATTSTTSPAAAASGTSTPAPTTTTTATPPPSTTSPQPSAQNSAGAKKKGGGSTTTTTAKDAPTPESGDAAATATQPEAPVEGLTLAQLADRTPGLSGRTVTSDDTGSADTVLAAAPGANDPTRRGRGTALLLAAAILVVLIGAAGAGYAWYHRSSRYEPA